MFDSPIARGSSVRIGHDGELLYAAGVFVDDGAVRANSLIRDHAGEDDLLQLGHRLVLSAAGEPERIYGGARLTGRAGTWEYGPLSIQTDERTGGSLSGSINRTAIRLRRRVLNPLSQVGGIATAVLGGEAGVVAAGGLDADIHVGRSHFLSATSALSRDSAAALAGSMRFTAEKRNTAGYAHRLNARCVEPAIERLFARPDVDYIHVRDTGAGCYDLRIERADLPGPDALDAERLSC